MWTLLILIVLAIPSVACDKGCTEYEGTCACDAPAEKASTVPEIAPSKEQPSHHPEAAWERGEVHAEMPLPETAESERDKMVAYEKNAEKNQK